MGDVSDMSGCPMCGGERRRNLYTLACVEGVYYRTCQCLDCRFVHMWPRPGEAYLAEYYSAADVYALPSERAEDYANVIADKVGLLRRFLGALAAIPFSGLAVDYGAGQGVTVKALSDLGFDAIGVEISAKARHAAETIFGVTMRDGDLSGFEDGEIAVLTMFDILEHIVHPKAFLKDAIAKLKPRGALLVVVPGYDSLERMIGGAASKALIFPEHVNQFTRDSISRMLRDCGFDVCYAGSPPPYGVAITFGLRQKMLKAFGRNPITLAVRDMLIWSKRHIVYPLPNTFVEKSGLFGQSLLVLARKPL